jgi:hypothetical protein
MPHLGMVAKWTMCTLLNLRTLSEKAAGHVWQPYALSSWMWSCACHTRWQSMDGHGRGYMGVAGHGCGHVALRWQFLGVVIYTLWTWSRCCSYGNVKNEFSHFETRLGARSLSLRVAPARVQDMHGNFMHGRLIMDGVQHCRCIDRHA